MDEEITQVSLEISVKSRLDRFKANHREEIMAEFKPSRNMVTNSMAVEHLLNIVEKKR